MLLTALSAVALASTPVRALHATSGDPELALDGDASTGWSPVGDPVGEGWILTLDDPSPVSRLKLRACPGQDPFAVSVWFDGVGAGRAVQVEPGLPRYVIHTADSPVERIEVRVVEAPGQVCLAEVTASGTGGALRLAPPDVVPGRLAASSVQEPAAAWAPRQAFDGRTDTAWVSAGSAAGETLWLTLEQPVDLVGVELHVGDLRDPAPQFPPGTPATVTLSVNGEPGRTHALSGSGPHLLPVAGSARSLALELGGGLDASPGRGTAVAEVRLWTSEGPLGVSLPGPKPPGESPVADRVLRPVCGPVAGLPAALRLRPDGTLTVTWEGQDAAGPWWTVLEGTWALPVQEGPTWSARVDGALLTRRMAARAEPVDPGAGPTLGGQLRIASVAGLEDGLVAADEGRAACPDAPHPDELIVHWNDAAQRMHPDARPAGMR